MYAFSYQFQYIMFSSDIVTVLNPESSQKEVFTKSLMDISVSYLHNYMIKAYDNDG